MLDVGCGSGVLGIASLLMGAESAVGVDIDDVAVRTAKKMPKLTMWLTALLQSAAALQIK